MALTKGKKTPQLNGTQVVPMMFDLPMKADAVIYSGGVVCTDSTGYAIPGDEALGLIVRGVAQESKSNAGGASGDKRVRVFAGCFKLKNSTAGEAIAITGVGKNCYLVDDEQVSKTDASGTRSLAGVVVAVDTDGVWVLLGISAPAQTALQAGTATLVAGTVTVTGAKLTSGSKIVATRNTKAGASVGVDLEIPSASRNVGDGEFVINSINADKSVETDDTSTVDWLVIG